MKKWWFLIPLFLLFLCGFFFVWSNPNIEIKTYQGTLIKELAQNKVPFQVTSRHKNATIKVNGEPVKSGYYQIGTYQVSATFFGRTVTKEVRIVPIEKREEYNLYLNATTYPLLMSALSLSANTHPSYLWTSRSGTLNEAILKERENLTISNYMGQTDSLRLVIEEAQTYINSILKMNPDAYFHLYLDDMQQWMEQAIMGSLGLTENRYDVTYFSDGTYSYTKVYEETKTKEAFEQAQAVYLYQLDQIRSHDITMIDQINPSFGLSYQTNQVLVAASRQNVHYQLAYPEFLKIQDEAVRELLSLEQVSAEDLYQTLTKEQQAFFFKLVQFDREQFEQTYFSKGDPRPVLIVTGSNPLQGSFTMDEFHQMLEKTKNQYGADYQLLYKPHPSAIPNSSEKSNLEQMGFQILPGKLPMEVLLFVYSDFKIGGFPSTLYLSAPKGNTLFFYERGETNLVSPLKELYQSFFPETYFLTP